MTGRSPGRRLTPLALATGLVSAGILALSMNTSLAAFTATITNTTDTVTSGSLVMQEQNADGTVTCLSTDGAGNSATCATINKYGAAVLVPGEPATTTVTIGNTGTVPASTFTLTPGTCTQSGGGTGSATDFCDVVGIVITQTVGTTTTTITPASSTLATLDAGGALTLTAPVAPGEVVTFSFEVTLGAGADNTYQGLTASQPLVWTFTS